MCIRLKKIQRGKKRKTDNKVLYNTQQIHRNTNMNLPASVFVSSLNMWERRIWEKWIPHVINNDQPATCMLLTTNHFQYWQRGRDTHYLMTFNPKWKLPKDIEDQTMQARCSSSVRGHTWLSHTTVNDAPLLHGKVNLPCINIMGTAEILLQAMQHPIINITCKVCCKPLVEIF